MLVAVWIPDRNYRLSWPLIGFTGVGFSSSGEFLSRCDANRDWHIEIIRFAFGECFQGQGRFKNLVFKQLKLSLGLNSIIDDENALEL